MYESFFAFSDRPFAAVPQADRYFPSTSIEEARTTLTRAIERSEGPGMVVGPAGTGKSLLCQILARQFRDRFDVVLLTSARLCTRRALLQNILFELNLPYRDRNEGELRLALIDHLEPGPRCPNGMLLVVDEAQTLPLHLLEEIRLITNLVREGRTRVRLVLAGNARLEERFAHPRLDSFNQRLAARCYLHAMTRQETGQYVHAQIESVGGRAEQVFGTDALSAIFQATDGIPRLINQICDHALLIACQAEQRTVNAQTIELAWADLQRLPTPWTTAATEPGSLDGPVIEFGNLDDESEPATVEEAVATVVDDDSISDASPIELAEDDDSAEPPVALRIAVESVAERVEELPLLTNPIIFEEETTSQNVPTTEPSEAQATETDAIETGDMETGDLGIEVVEERIAAAEPEADPFGEGFDDEEIVVDRYAQLDAAGDDIPPLNCPEPTSGNAAPAETGITLEEPAVETDVTSDATDSVDSSVYDTAPSAEAAGYHVVEFAQQQFEDQGEGPLADETTLEDEAATPEPADDGAELTDDDRDMIVVSREDEPEDVVEPTGQRGKPRDYRKLFARLRRG